MKKHGPIINGFPHMLHGADYNPEQWFRTPEIWEEDMRLWKLAHMNSLSVGIFSWAALEPEEGVYHFEWLDDVMDRIAAQGGKAVLATPSAARPHWLAQKYPEVLRVQANRRRNLFGERHNHCYSSPIYREKVAGINRMLAERYRDHPALGVWHISNEYGGECHCELCQENFRKWLRKKYNNDLDKLNEQWWTGFWSHTYTDWSQIESPAPHGENSVHGLALDWRRFVTYMTGDFIDWEVRSIRELTPNTPITTNLMGDFYDLNYWELAKHIDVVSWDAYPMLTGREGDDRIAMETSFQHDGFRGLKGKPFMLMESVPGTTNWRPRATLKRPGQHLQMSLQAVAHGSDTVQYFQFRKSRGSFEKFHGAVVDHTGDERNRNFRDVQSVGQALEKLDAVVGTAVDAEAAVIFDRENWWALSFMMGLINESRANTFQTVRDKEYLKVVKEHYNALWRRSIAVDVVSSEADFSGYKLVVAPMLYMVKPGVAERLTEFVRNGGTLVTTYWCGVVNENDLCYLGGFPGPLRELMGIWAEEIDTLPRDAVNTVLDPSSGTMYEARDYCELSHLESARGLMAYNSDFYEGMPALTVNEVGAGKVYYQAFRGGEDFLKDFYSQIANELNISNPLGVELPNKVHAAARTDGENEYIFLFNYSDGAVRVELPAAELYDMLEDKPLGEALEMEAFGTKALRKKI